ncbi:hypothetical protein ACQKND_04020 [Viridibacillus arvi]|uniref:hypothetical protein n=1 Tax=Viridibacillus arvi TaxID=263475 RepID=UPI003CFE9EA6
MKQLSIDKEYYFQDKKIIVIEDFYPFNMAIVHFVDTNEEITIDTNFIRTTPSLDKYISLDL